MNALINFLWSQKSHDGTFTSQKHNGKKQKKKSYARNSHEEIEPETECLCDKKMQCKKQRKKEKVEQETATGRLNLGENAYITKTQNQQPRKKNQKVVQETAMGRLGRLNLAKNAYVTKMQWKKIVQETATGGLHLGPRE